MGGLFEHTEGTTTTKSAFAAIAPRFSGGLSAISSLLIIYAILRGDKKLSTIYHRIVFSMSCADVVGSIAMALTTLPMPMIDPDIELKKPSGEDILQYAGKRLGTVQTCRTQGFLVVFGMITMFGYNATLCVYYACVIGFKMKEATMKKRVEPFLHLLPLTAGVGLASIPLILGDLYKPAADPWCTLSPTDAALPTPQQNGEPTELRIMSGEEIAKFLIVIFLFLIVFAFALIIVRIIYIGRRLKHISSRIRYNSPCSVNAQLELANRTHQNTKVIVIQAAWYILAFAFSLIFALVRLILHNNYPFVDGGQFLLMPLQGFFNALIFFGHKIYNYRRTHPGVSRTYVLCLFLQGKAVDPVLMSRISLVEINDGTIGEEGGADDNVVMRLEVSDENGEHEMLSSSPSVDYGDKSDDDDLEECDVFERDLSYPSDTSHQNSEHGNDACVDADETRNLDGFSYISSFSSTTPQKSTGIGSSDLSFSTGQKSTNTTEKSTDTGSSDFSLNAGQKSTNAGSSNLSFSRSGGSNAESIQEKVEL